MTKAIDMGWFILNKYYTMTDSVPVYAAATLLDPSKRYAWIKQNWPEEWWDHTIDGARSIWNSEYRDVETLALTAVGPAPVRQQTRQPLDPIFESIRSSLQVAKTTVSTDNDDFESFIHRDAILIDCTALEWWCQLAQRSRYPRLSQMAIDILSIPPESADVERVFSGCRRTLSWDRARMTIENLEMVECVGNWQAEGIVQQQLQSMDINVYDDGEKEGLGVTDAELETWGL